MDSTRSVSLSFCSWWAREKKKPGCPDVCQLQMARELISCFNQSTPLKEITAITLLALELGHYKATSWPCKRTVSSTQLGLASTCSLVEPAGGWGPPQGCYSPSLTGQKPTPPRGLQRPRVSTPLPDSQERWRSRSSGCFRLSFIFSGQVKQSCLHETNCQDLWLPDKSEVRVWISPCCTSF